MGQVEGGGVWGWVQGIGRQMLPASHPDFDTSSIASDASFVTASEAPDVAGSSITEADRRRFAGVQPRAQQWAAEDVRGLLRNVKDLGDFFARQFWQTDLLDKGMAITYAAFSRTVALANRTFSSQASLPSTSLPSTSLPLLPQSEYDILGIQPPSEQEKERLQGVVQNALYPNGRSEERLVGVVADLVARFQKSLIRLFIGPASLLLGERPQREMERLAAVVVGNIRSEVPDDAIPNVRQRIGGRLLEVFSAEKALPLNPLSGGQQPTQIYFDSVVARLAARESLDPIAKTLLGNELTGPAASVGLSHVWQPTVYGLTSPGRIDTAFCAILDVLHDALIGDRRANSPPAESDQAIEPEGVWKELFEIFVEGPCNSPNTAVFGGRAGIYDRIVKGVFSKFFEDDGKALRSDTLAEKLQKALETPDEKVNHHNRLAQFFNSRSEGKDKALSDKLEGVIWRSSNGLSDTMQGALMSGAIDLKRGLETLWKGARANPALLRSLLHDIMQICVEEIIPPLPDVQANPQPGSQGPVQEEQLQDQGFNE